MHAEGFFAQAVVYLAAAVVAVPVAKRLGLGSVLGYLIAGAIIGPYGLGFVGSEGQDIMHIAEFGVVMMLFLVGLELEPSLLWRLRMPVLGMGGLQVLATAAVTGGVALAFGLAWQAALAVGLTLAMSSTAIVLQTLNERRLMNTAGGQSAFAVLLFQDLAVIPILAVFPLLGTGAMQRASGGAEHTWLGGLPGWAQTLAVAGTVALVVLAGRFLVQPALRAIARTKLRELFTASALLLVLGIAQLMAAVGLSPALGTFLAGVVLANSEYRHELEGDIEPFKGLLLGLFFIAVGASVDFALTAAQPGRMAALVAAIVIAKVAVLLGLGRAFGLRAEQNLLLALGLSQVGEFAFVLLSFAAQHGVLAQAVTSPLVAAVALSMATTPLLLLIFERWVRPRLERTAAPTRAADAIHERNPVVIAGFGRFGTIVGRLLRAQGIGTTVLDVDGDKIDLLRRMGLKVFYGDASRLELLQAAGAAEARLLVLAVDDPAKTLELVHLARRHFPHLTILARASDRRDAYDLVEAGVTHIYRETLDTSLRLGVDALRLLGHRAYSAQRAARAFLRHDEESVRMMSGVRQDQARYLSVARSRIADLERTLLADLHDQGGADRDAGWDAESLRAEFGGR
jgi:monovalent cation:proton antiporter-2 (CPA2) family protein